MIGKEELNGVGNTESAKLEKGLEIQQEIPTKVQPAHTDGSNDPLTSSTSNSGSFPEKSRYPLGLVLLLLHNHGLLLGSTSIKRE